MLETSRNDVKAGGASEGERLECAAHSGYLLINV